MRTSILIIIALAAPVSADVIYVLDGALFRPGLVESAAKRHRLSPALLHAVIKAESNGDPLAVSSAGAQGLMQLMPATSKRFGVTDPFDEEENIEGGARYLRELIDEFGTWKLALAAYNAGEGAVRKYNGIPPFSETRDFVSKILKSLGK